MPKIDFSDLIRTGQIQEESSIGWDQIERLMKRSYEDLKSAESSEQYHFPTACLPAGRDRFNLETCPATELVLGRVTLALMGFEAR
ncbi:MAG: hypothetical protein HYS55_03045 [Candidatus Omnitrophica bacterium]|nr:hypothetical protein [Candidatus Omnitrophota bacterium]